MTPNKVFWSLFSAWVVLMLGMFWWTLPAEYIGGW